MWVVKKVVINYSEVNMFSLLWCNPLGIPEVTDIEGVGTVGLGAGDSSFLGRPRVFPDGVVSAFTEVDLRAGGIRNSLKANREQG